MKPITNCFILFKTTQVYELTNNDGYRIGETQIEAGDKMKVAELHWNSDNQTADLFLIVGWINGVQDFDVLDNL